MMDCVKTFYVKLGLSNNRYKNAFSKLDKLAKEFGQELGDIEIKSVQDEIWYETLGAKPEFMELIERGIKRTLIYNSLEIRIR